MSIEDCKYPVIITSSFTATQTSIPMKTTARGEELDEHLSFENTRPGGVSIRLLRRRGGDLTHTVKYASVEIDDGARAGAELVLVDDFF